MTPNPGSPKAIKLGCLCPQMDNCYGAGIPWPDENGKQDKPSFWINLGCPLHSVPWREGTDDE